MPISAQQKKILAFPYSNYDAIICDGSVRSGKTSIMTWAFVGWAMQKFNGQRFGLCGKTGQVLTKKTDADFDAEWQDSKGGAGGKTEDEALELLAEAGMISPLVGDDGIIITDKNDYILSL